MRIACGDKIDRFSQFSELEIKDYLDKCCGIVGTNDYCQFSDSTQLRRKNSTTEPDCFFIDNDLNHL